MKFSSIASRIRRSSLWSPLRSPVASFKASCSGASSSIRRSILKAAAASTAFLVTAAVAASPLRLVRSPCSATVPHPNARRRFGFGPLTAFLPFRSESSAPSCPASPQPADMEATTEPPAETTQDGDEAPKAEEPLTEPSPSRQAVSADADAGEGTPAKTNDDTEPDSIPEKSEAGTGTTSDETEAPYWSGQDVFRETATFKLADGCKLVLHIGDITKWGVDGKSDAIVNAANERMLGGGGVDGAIHRAAGPELLEMCKAAPQVYPGVRCPTGSAVTTGAGGLPVKHVIHTVGPIYHAVDDPAALLSSAYRSSMENANAKGVKYVAFPAISCGIYGYPPDEGAEVSLKAVQENCGTVKEVHFVLFSAKEHKAWLKGTKELELEETTVRS